MAYSWILVAGRAAALLTVCGGARCGFADFKRCNPAAPQVASIDANG
jgi:hypothetical protein